MATDELETRYGRRLTQGHRRAFTAAIVVVLAITLGWSAWFALTIGSPTVTWQDLGYRETSSGLDVTFEVTFDESLGAAASAICTLQALNQGRTEVGRVDVRAGPIGTSGYRTLRLTAAVPTSEPAVTGLVKECILTSPGP